MQQNVYSTNRFLKYFSFLSVFLFFLISGVSAYCVTVNVQDTNGNPLNTVNMKLSRVSDNTEFFSLFTNASGIVQLGLNYPNIANFPPGTYSVRNTTVPAGNGKIYFPTYYGGLFTTSNATTFTVASGQTTDVGNITLKVYEQVTINGQVQNSAGVGIPGSVVMAFIKFSGFTYVSKATADGSGNYALPVPASVNPDCCI
jgi:hypothetical protein